jgi:hypothetical protein
MRRKQIDSSAEHNVPLNGSLLIVGTTILLCFLFFITSFLYIRLQQNKISAVEKIGIGEIYAEEKNSHSGETRTSKIIIPFGPVNRIL